MSNNNNKIKLSTPEDWLLLQEIYEAFPLRKKEERKTFFDIAGVSSKELINSRFLQFYLLEEEEHGLGRLFLDSLLEIMEVKIKAKKLDFESHYFTTSYSVENEARTREGKYIDLVIQENVQETGIESSWAIIIENKLNADLYNPLNIYYNHVKADYKWLIVLSLKKEKVGNGKNRLNILHSEWIERIKAKLGHYYLQADDRHLLFLKDYIQNIESFKNIEFNRMKNNEVLQLFHGNNNVIRRLVKEDERMTEFIHTTTEKVLEEKGFRLSTKAKGVSSNRHFYFKKETEVTKEEYTEILKVLGLDHETASFLKRFRFWVDLSRLKYDNAFLAYFELWDKSVLQHGEAIQGILEEKGILKNGKEEGVNKGSSNSKNYCHIYYLWIPLGDEGDLETRLRKKLDDDFFNHGSKYLKLAMKALQKAINSPSEIK